MTPVSVQYLQGVKGMTGFRLFLNGLLEIVIWNTNRLCLATIRINNKSYNGYVGMGFLL